MPEIAITPKNRGRSGFAATCSPDQVGSPVERNLARCARRRLETSSSQLPVRCHRTSPYYRPPRASFRFAGLTAIDRSITINAANSCPGSAKRNIVRMIATPRCKKSLSMIDLSPTITEPESGDLRSESSSTLERLEEVGERMKEMIGNDIGIRRAGWIDGFATSESEGGGSGLYEDPKKAASLVCRVLLVNAWRRRRLETEELREAIGKLSQQIEHLHLQIIVLRRLLDTENSRVGKLTGEAHRAKIQLDDALREKEQYKVEKEKREEDIKRLTEVSEQRAVAVENVRNELLTAQSQIRALDEQLEREREKLLKLREDKKILAEKVTVSEAVSMERGARADKAESIVEDLQVKLATQIALVESSQEEMRRCAKELKAKEEEKLKLEKRLKSKEEAARSLTLRTNFLESELADRESTLRRIESAYSTQLMELNDMRERLVRQSEEVGWSSRVLQIANSVVRAPRAILRSLSLFSTAGQAVTL